MARKQLVPPGAKRGGRGKAPPVPPAANGKSNGKTPPVAAKGRSATRGAPLASPPPRKRTAPGMPLPTGNPTPVMRAPAVAVHIMPPADADEVGGGRLGPAMAAAAGSSPKRRAVAQAMRGGRMAF